MLVSSVTFLSSGCDALDMVLVWSRSLAKAFALLCLGDGFPMLPEIRTTPLPTIFAGRSITTSSQLFLPIIFSWISWKGRSVAFVLTYKWALSTVVDGITEAHIQSLIFPLQQEIVICLIVHIFFTSIILTNIHELWFRIGRFFWVQVGKNGWTSLFL